MRQYRLKPIIALAIIILLLIGVGIGITSFIFRKKSASAPVSSYGVITSKLETTPTPLPDSVMALVKDSVDRVVTTKHGKGTYTATYRDGSYHRVVTPSGGIVLTLLIDVKETHETYSFTRTGGDNGPSDTYTHCAPESDQLVHPSICKDPGEGY